MIGVITTIKLDGRYGFIRPADGPDVFFHADDLDEALDFDEQLLELDVQFSIEDAPKGPRAHDVRLAN